MNALEFRSEFLEEPDALSGNGLGQWHHLFIPWSQLRLVPHPILREVAQEDVALLHEVMVLNEPVEIGTVVLADDRIHPFAANLAPIKDQHRIGRGNHDDRITPHVVRKLGIRLSIALEQLLLPLGHGTGHAVQLHLARRVLHGKGALHEEGGLAMTDVLGVDGIEVSLGIA